MFVFSGCANVANSHFVDHQETLPDFSSFVEEFLKKTTFIPAKTKDELPLFMLAEFAAAGVRRCVPNVLKIHGLVLDIDKGTIKELQPSLDLIETYGHILYTTFSHDWEGQLKIRIIVKLSREVDITEWRSFWQRAINYFGLNLLIDNKCSDAAHLYFVPGGDRDKYEVYGDNNGPALDVNEVLDMELPPGVADLGESRTQQDVLAEEDRAEIDEGLVDLWNAKLHHLCDEIRQALFPGEIYGLKSHRVFGLARGVPHIMEESRLRNMVRNALNARYRNKKNPELETWREKSFEQVDIAIKEGMGVPWYPPKINDITTHALNDLGLARRLLDRHSEDLCWEDAWGQWLVWQGQFWNLEAGRALAKKRMIETTEHIHEEADAHMHDYLVAQEKYDAVKDDPNISDEVRGQAKFEYEAMKKRIEEIYKFELKSQNKPKIAAGIDLANCDSRVLISHSQLNRDPWLLNYENGTLDLKTAQLHAHNRRDYITRMAPHEFNAAATCPTFNEFLLQCMKGRERMVRFLWRLLGYSAIGVTDEQILVLNIGEGANGKSTFMNVILRALGTGEGGYAWSANSENLLTAKGGNRHETWRMSLFGRRLVAALEVEEGRTFNESLIKELTGSDQITGRRMRQDEWSYIPNYQLWLSANHLPMIRGTDEGIWRRIMVIPWEVSFRGREDKTLPERVQAEIPGILARIAREAVAWREEGLKIPREVQAATLRYRREQDPLQPFIDAFCTRGAVAFVERGLLWAAYLEHSETVKTQVFHDKKKFFAAVAKRFKLRKRRGVHGFVGLRLKTREERHAANPRIQLMQAQKKQEEDENKKKFSTN